MAANFCLPLSATLQSSPILRAGLTNPPMTSMQKTMGDLDKASTSDERVSGGLQGHEGLLLKHRFQSTSPIAATSGAVAASSPGSTGTGTRIRQQHQQMQPQQPLTFSKFEDYNKKRGTWDLSPLHPKTLPFSDSETISHLVEKVATSTYKLASEEQEDLCYKCVLIGHLPAELRPYWEDPRSQGGDYGTPAKVPAINSTSGLAYPVTPPAAGSNLSQCGSSYGSSPLSSASIVAQAVQSLSASHLAVSSTVSPGQAPKQSVVSSSPVSLQGPSKQSMANIPAEASSSIAGVVSQFQSERLDTESHDRINSVISQVLRSSTQPMDPSNALTIIHNGKCCSTLVDIFVSYGFFKTRFLVRI